MAMDKFLAEYYGTAEATKTAAAQAEDLEKQASVELFMKLASDQKIDLSKMPEADVQKLYDNWVKAASAPAAGTAATPAPAVEKTAEEKEKEEKEKKLEEAKKEHEEKKAQSEKVAEADFLGRVMAHAYCQELRSIAEKTAAAPAAPAVKTAEEEKKEKEDKEDKEKAEKDKHEPPKGGDEHHEEGKHHMPPAFMEHLKHASALDKVAGERAYELASQAGIDPVLAFSKVAGVINLGLLKETSEKVASANFADAIGIRALELLEKAGYPVTWNK
jgi:hypothetical protein